MPGPSLIVSKDGVKVREALPTELSFSSDYNLNKIARVKKCTTEDSFTHGLTYAPQILTMREIISGKFGYGALAGVDDTNVYPEIATIGGETDTASWIYIMVDNLSTGTFKKNLKGHPVILIGEDTGTDYSYELHSGYDTFKVATTGTLTLEVDEYDPGSGGGTETQTETYNHGLGYVPLFGPFVQYETIMPAYYQWNGQFNSAGTWSISTKYYVGQVAQDSSSTEYLCLETHTSSSSDEPGVGANWEDYWELYSPPDEYDTYVNALEDQKYVFGGVEYFNSSTVRLYATSTQLVLELERYCYPDDEPLYSYTPCPAEKVTVDYTIFYNRADEEFNLLD